MKGSQVLDVATSNKHIDADDDDSSVIYFHGEYRTINDILLDDMSDINRNAVLSINDDGIDGNAIVTLNNEPKRNIVREFNKDFDCDHILSEDEIVSYISAVRNDIGFTTELDRKQLSTIKISILYRMLQGEIDVVNYNEIMIYIMGAI